MARTKLIVAEFREDYAKALQAAAAEQPGAAIFSFEEDSRDDFTFTPGIAIRIGAVETQKEYRDLNHGRKIVPPGYRPGIDTNADAWSDQWVVKPRQVRIGYTACLVMCDERFGMAAWREQALALVSHTAVTEAVQTEGAA
jgi:hypothetical protein